MRRKAVSGFIIALLSIGVLTLASNVQQVESSEPPETQWTLTYGGVGRDIARCVVETNVDPPIIMAEVPLDFALLAILEACGGVAFSGSIRVM